MPPRIQRNFKLRKELSIRWEDIIEIKTSILKRKIYSEIIKVQVLETGPQQYKLLLLFESDLRRLSLLQELADNNDSEFQGAIDLVQKIMELGYDSQLGHGTNEHGDTRAEKYFQLVAQRQGLCGGPCRLYQS